MACAVRTTFWSTSLYARQKKLQIGPTSSLLNHTWRLVGIIEGGKLARVVVPLKTLQDLDSADGKSPDLPQAGRPAQHRRGGALHRRNTSLKVNTMDELPPCTA
jgi:hypothetical protein